VLLNLDFLGDAETLPFKYTGKAQDIDDWLNHPGYVTKKLTKVGDWLNKSRKNAAIGCGIGTFVGFIYATTFATPEATVVIINVVKKGVRLVKNAKNLMKLKMYSQAFLKAVAYAKAFGEMFSPAGSPDPKNLVGEGRGLKLITTTIARGVVAAMGKETSDKLVEYSKKHPIRRGKNKK